MGFIQYESERLIIRDHVNEDINDYFAIFSDDKNTFMTPFIKTATIEDAKKALAYAVKEITKPKREDYFFKIINKSDNSHIGQIGFSVIEETPAGLIVEVGYFLRHEHWSMGYATEALRATIKYCFENMNVHRFEASCLLKNIASKTVIEKNNLIFEGISRKYSYHNGSMCDRVRFALLREDFEKLYSINFIS